MGSFPASLILNLHYSRFQFSNNTFHQAYGGFQYGRVKSEFSSGGREKLG